MAESDITSVAQLEAASYAFPWTEGIFHDCLRVDYVCNVLEIDSILGGYSIVAMGAGEAHLLNLCVREQFRFRGLGARLLRHLVEQSRAAGARVMFLETRPSNQAAIRLYQASNFVQIGIRRGYYQAVGGREDALVMRRTLI